MLRGFSFSLFLSLPWLDLFLPLDAAADANVRDEYLVTFVSISLISPLFLLLFTLDIFSFFWTSRIHLRLPHTAVSLTHFVSLGRFLQLDCSCLSENGFAIRAHVKNSWNRAILARIFSIHFYYIWNLIKVQGPFFLVLILYLIFFLNPMFNVTIFTCPPVSKCVTHLVRL